MSRSKSWCWPTFVLIFTLLLGQILVSPTHGQNVTKCTYTDRYIKNNPCKDDKYTCSVQEQCVRKGCLYDPNDTKSQAPACADDKYCPYNQIQCLPKLPLGEACSLETASYPCLGDTDIICLNQLCTSKNVTLGGQCTIDEGTNPTTPIDNCMINTFCSDTTKLCTSAFAIGESCSNNFQCVSGSCSNGKCQESNDQVLYHSLPVWVYILIGVACGLAVLFCALFIYFRRRNRMRNYKKMLNLSMTTLNQFGNNRDSNPNPTSQMPNDTNNR